MRRRIAIVLCLLSPCMAWANPYILNPSPLITSYFVAFWSLVAKTGWATIRRTPTVTEIGNMLHNLPAGQTNAHHYRFCFVDGCSTAKGAMPEAFGIPHKENVPGDYYGAAGRRYSAYVGWKSKKIIGVGLNGGEGEINTEHVNFIVFIQDDMLLNNENIKQAMGYAARQPGISSFHEDSMTVYGYWGLKFGTQN